MNLMRGIDLKKIAEKMNGASGAELKVCFHFIYFLFQIRRHFYEQVVGRLFFSIGPRFQ